METKPVNSKILALLLEKGRISESQFRTVENEQKNTGESAEHILVTKNLIKEKEIAQLVSEELNIPYVDLSFYIVDEELISLISEEAARRFKVIPLFRIKDTLTVALVNPGDVIALDDLKIRTGYSIQPVISTETEILKAIRQYYGSEKSMEELIKPLQKKSLNFVSEERLTSSFLHQLAEDPPIVKFVNQMILKAVKEKASDVHIETDETQIKIRYRIDGLLYDVIILPKEIGLSLIPRLKVLASLDITERRKPQDGRFSLTVENRKIDFRISTFPLVYGEKVVIRILDKDLAVLDLDKIGLAAPMLEKFNSLVKSPNGIILVTGPTGSGKTTTLYSVLNKISSREKNILTIEDPIEYILPGINQSQVNPKIGLDFATGLRSFLRQDPDVIMVGEIRDKETAQIAIRAAQTGHLVLSSLHTNDACGAITRLIDMEIEPFLIASSVIGVLAQRLVRVICPECKKTYALTPEDQERLRTELKFSNQDLAKTNFFKGKGCVHCHHTGYQGRIGIFELLIIDEPIKKLILQKAGSSQIIKTALEKGMTGLRLDGLEKVFQGITTLEEVMLVTQTYPTG